MSIENEDIDVRSGTTAEWAASTLVAGRGELLVNVDNGEVRVGDGTNTYANLKRHDGAIARGNTTLVAGTKNVTSLTGVATGDLVFAQVRTLGTVTAPKTLVAVAGTDQITITSSDNTDTSVVNYVVFKA